MAEEYTTIRIRIFERKSSTGPYPIEASVDGGAEYKDQLEIDQSKLPDPQSSPKEYGLALFDSLFIRSIRDAHIFASSRANSQTGGRLRVHLRIDDGAPELHAVRWEALYHTYRGEEIPLAISTNTPFSRYTALEHSEARPLSPPLKLLFAIANPSDLAEDGLAPLDVEAEIRSLRTALGKFDHSARLKVTIMPGRTGLSESLQAELDAAGYEITPGATSLENLQRSLSGYHIFHFLGHGAYNRSREQAALIMEREEEGEKWGKSERVSDSRIKERIGPLGDLRLVFLAACKSAERNTDRDGPDGPNPFVGLAPKLVRSGVPAVVAMQDNVEIGAARQLVAKFYGALLDHGYVDQALNEARLTLYSEKNDQWTIPVLNMRLEDGWLFTPQAPAVRHGIKKRRLKLPAHYVVRPIITQNLQEQLLSAQGAPAVTLLHGMPASGKTTLAKALALAAWDHFGDGVLWVTLGQQPEILGRLGELIQGLGDYDFRPTTVEGASQYLDDLLADKLVLLVLDDAWEYEHVAPFLVGGPRCHVLVTSRRSTVVGDHPDESFDYRLRVLTENQALEVLARLLGKTAESPFSEEEREQARVLVDIVGGQSLALELAAGRIARGSSWEELTTALKAEIAELDALEPDARRRLKGNLRVEATINVSLDRLREEFEPAWQNFVWLGALPEDATINPVAAATWWQVKPEKAADALEYLYDENLLLEAPTIQLGEKTWQAYTLHDLLHDVVRRRLVAPEPQGLGFSLREVNQELLTRYRQLTTDNLWHTLPADGYIQANLTWHMERAGQIEAIHHLLAEQTEGGRNGWYLAPDPPDKGNAYPSDVYRAWRLAEEAYEKEPDGLAIGRQCRYALIIASLNSLSGNLPPELLAALVQCKLWSPQKALAYVEQIPDEWSGQKAEALERLAPQLYVELLPSALAIVETIDDVQAQVLVLAALAPRLLEMVEVLAALAPRQPEAAEALAALSLQLPEGGRAEAVAEALAAARADRVLSRVLAVLAPRFPEAAEALAALVLQLPEGERAETVAEALAGARADRVLSRVQATLTPQLLEGAMDEALATARTIDVRWIRAKALTFLALKLPERGRAEVVAEALATAQLINDVEHRVRALAALAPRLPERGRVKVLAEALAVAQAIEDVEYRARTLTFLAPKLPERERADVLVEALIAAKAIDTAQHRARALTSLVPHLPEGERPEVVAEALVAARTINTAWDRARALASLVPNLPGEDRPEVVTEALAAGPATDRAEFLADLAAQLPEGERAEVVAEALAAVQATGDSKYRAEFLADLAAQLPEGERVEVVAEALAAVQDINVARSRARLLAALAPYLPEDLSSQALALAKALHRRRDRAEALAALALRLPEEERAEIVSQTLVAARAINNAWDRARALATLAPQLPEGQRAEVVTEALKAARAIDSVAHRAKPLASLALQLPEGERAAVVAEALEAARAINNAWDRVEALTALARHLPDEERGETVAEALEAAQAIDSVKHRAEILAALAPLLTELPQAGLHMRWREALPALARRSRASVLSDLRALLPVIEAMGGREAIEETAQAILDVGRWWP